MLDSYHVHVVIDRLAAVREAVGPDVDIIMENHSYRCAGRSATGRAGEKNIIYCFLKNQLHQIRR